MKTRADIFTLSTTPGESKPNLWTQVSGTFSEGVWNFSQLSPSADLLPPVWVTPPGGLSLLYALKQNEHKSCFFASSVLWYASSSTHTAARNPNVSPFPGDLCKIVIYQKNSKALTVLTDIRLSCTQCISDTGAQFNLVRSNKRAKQILHLNGKRTKPKKDVKKKFFTGIFQNSTPFYSTNDAERFSHKNVGIRLL